MNHPEVLLGAAGCIGWGFVSAAACKPCTATDWLGFIGILLIGGCLFAAIW